MITAILLLGGSGSRLSSSLPKQFILVKNKPLFVHALSAFKDVDNIILVTKEEYLHLTECYVKQYNLTKVREIIVGGKNRQQSVYNGLQSKFLNDDDIVLIHDAARCNIKREIVQDNINMLQEGKYENVLTACKEVNTVYQNKESGLSLLNREEIVCAQTPQSFFVKNIRKLHEKYKDQTFSDDISLAVTDGQKIGLVISSDSNFKVTTDMDLRLFEEIKNQ